jgi:hypothetical protein
MTTDPITGRCLCGGVRFAIDGPLGTAGYCHCARCQRRTGTAASIQARIDGDALHFVSGEQLLSAYDPGDGGFQKLFCSACGSALFSRNPSDWREMSVRLGALDGDPGVSPSYRQYLAYAATWEPVPEDGVPRYPESRPPVV